MTVHILSMRDRAPEGATVIDTTTRSKNWSRGLSPMILRLDGAKVENIWQYSKVYPQHWDADLQQPTLQWYDWMRAGMNQDWAERYPMGRGAKPVCSWDLGRALDYIEARKHLYLPVYRDAVLFTDAFLSLKLAYQAQGEIWLRDFDGYDHRRLGMEWDDVLNCETKKMGHAFVLGMMLEKWL